MDELHGDLDLEDIGNIEQDKKIQPTLEALEQRIGERKDAIRNRIAQALEGGIFSEFLVPSDADDRNFDPPVEIFFDVWGDKYSKQRSAVQIKNELQSMDCKGSL